MVLRQIFFCLFFFFSNNPVHADGEMGDKSLIDIDV